MKKIVILAISAILAFNASAQDFRNENHNKKLSKEQRVELEIQRLTKELFLSEKQAEKFAKTYREFAAKVDEVLAFDEADKEDLGKNLSDRELDKLAKKKLEKQKKLIDLKENYYGKFRKTLNARQTAIVLRLDKQHKCKQACCEKGRGHEKKEHGLKDKGSEPRRKHGSDRR